MKYFPLVACAFFAVAASPLACGNEPARCGEFSMAGGGLFGSTPSAGPCTDASLGADSQSDALYGPDGELLDGTAGDGSPPLGDGSLASDARTDAREGGAPPNCVPYHGADGGPSPACSDCIDNDGDGLVDWFDPECSGPLDNDEGTFGTGIPGDNVDACKQDCFFDGNSGQGDDGCDANLKCDPKNSSASCPYDPNYANCPITQSRRCLDYCRPLVPNGCDCFGCCTVPRPGGGTANIRLSSTCSAATLDDPTKCDTCTPNTACQNPCAECEICVGKPTLPASCNPSTRDAGAPADGGLRDGGSASGDSGGPSTDAGTGQICAGGEPICNATTPCAGGYYCLTGCCVLIDR